MITLSVVLYKSPRTALSHLLDSCSGTRGISLTASFVDNSPTDDLRAPIERRGFTYLHRPDNPGYGASHNFAFERIGDQSRYHFIINPDISFGADDLATLVGYMDSNEDVGLVMPKLTYPDGAPQYLCKLLPTPLNLIARRFFGQSAFVREWDARYELRFTGYDKIMDVPYLSGCFMLARSSLFRDIGGFDERFFMYLEDTDLTRRIGNRARTVFYPKVTVTHEYAKGSFKLNRLFAIHIVSAFRYFNKWGWFFDAERSAINTATLRRLTKSV